MKVKMRTYLIKSKVVTNRKVFSSNFKEIRVAADLWFSGSLFQLCDLVDCTE